MLKSKTTIPPDAILMLDTNVFNRVLDGVIPASRFVGRRVLVTGVQHDELSSTSELQRKAALLKTFESIGPEVTLAASFAFDIEGAGFGQAYWNDGSCLFEKMRNRLHELDRSRKWRSRKSAHAIFLNQERDILIAETAIKSGAVLVTSDSALCRVVVEFGGRAMGPEELI